ncbi:hypothetical protein LguiB_013650 [Lonicera macranthoides]
MNGYSVNANVVVPIPGAPHPVAVAPLPCFRGRFSVFSSEGLSVPTYKLTTNTSTTWDKAELAFCNIGHCSLRMLHGFYIHELACATLIVLSEGEQQIPNYRFRFFGDLIDCWKGISVL